MLIEHRFSCDKKADYFRIKLLIKSKKGKIHIIKLLVEIHGVSNVIFEFLRFKQHCFMFWNCWLDRWWLLQLLLLLLNLFLLMFRLLQLLYGFNLESNLFLSLAFRSALRLALLLLNLRLIMFLFLSIINSLTRRSKEISFM